MKETLTITEHQEIKVDEIRNISKLTISDKDKKLLLSITHKDRYGKEKYVFSRARNLKNGLKSNSIVGSISLKSGLIVEILPKYAKGDLNSDSVKKYRKTLLNMIRVSNEKNFISSTTQSSKISIGEMPLIRYMIELFSESLLNSLRNKSFFSYNKIIEKSSYIRGNILVAKTIQANLIDKSKIYISYNKHSSNNILMSIFKTLSKLLLDDTNLSYKAKNNLHEVYLLLDDVDIINIKQQDFKKTVFNRLNDNFEVLFKQAEFIFNQYMPFSSSINSTPFWAILFDMNYLFEKFCAYLFRKSNIKIKEQDFIKCFSSKYYDVNMKPDFTLYNNGEVVSVVDAKWKLLSENKTLHGLNSQNFWQLFSYMNLSSKEEINGYFIAPKNTNKIDDEIVFSSKKTGHKNINILSIDFSLDFEDIISKYRFEFIDSHLRLKKIKPINNQNKKEGFCFDLFIEELNSLDNNKKIGVSLCKSKRSYSIKSRFHSLIFLKKKRNINSRNFRYLVKENVRIISCDLQGVKLTNITSNITKLKNLKHLNILDNNILTISPEILKLNNLKILKIDKKSAINNREVIKELMDKHVEIYDSSNKKVTIKMIYPYV